MTIHDLKHLHPDDIKLWLAVEEATFRFARAQKVKINCVVPTSKLETPGQSGAWLDCTRSMEITLRRWDPKRKKWLPLFSRALFA